MRQITLPQRSREREPENMMDPLTNEGHLPLTNQADQLRTMNRVNPEQLVPKIETGIIDITPHSHLEHQSTLDSPQKIDSPINDDQGNENMYIQNTINMLARLRPILFF